MIYLLDQMFPILLEATSGQVGDLFSSESSFQQPAVPPVRRTKRQASIVCIHFI